MPPKRSASDKQRLALALSRVCALQRQYGKTDAELETLVEGFCWVLGDYSMGLILAGIAEFVKRSNEIPTPADIANLVDPPTPPLSAAVYVAYQKKAKEGAFLLSDERAYCRAYEAQETEKTRGGSREFREAQREINLHAKRLEIGFDGDYE